MCCGKKENKKRGNVILSCSDNILICEDVVKLLKKIPDGSIHCVITSPPYWKGFAYESYFNSYKQYLDWTNEWMGEIKRVLHPNGTFYLNISNDSETTVRAYELMEIATRDLLFKLHDTIVWYVYNRQPANTVRQLTNQMEFIFMLRHNSNDVYLDKKEAYHYNPDLFKTRNVGNVWELPFNVDKRGKSSVFGRKTTKSNYGHGGFPVALPETCLLLSTRKGQIVLDPFMGTGTTGVACKKHCRRFIGVDNIQEFVGYSRKRIDGETYL